MTEENPQPQIINKINVSLWKPLWIAGYMFTVSYLPIDPSFHILVWWKQIVYIFIEIILWPAILGGHLSGKW